MKSKINIKVLCLLLVFISSLPIFSQASKITITSPSDGEFLSAGSDYYITWTSINVSSVRLEYSNKGSDQWYLIKELIPVSVNSFKWKVPNQNNNIFLIRITAENNESVQSTIEFMVGSGLVEEGFENSMDERNGLQIANPIKIMPLGNSITRGSSGSPDRIGYRRKLYLSLNGLGYNVDFIGSMNLGIPSDFDKDHEGHSGWHAKHPTNPDISIADNLYSFLELNPPKIILLHLGTNDIIGLETFNEDEYDVVDDIDSVLNIIDSFEDSSNTDIYVVIAKIINREDDSATTSIAEDQVTTAYNNELQNLVDNRISNGDKLYLVDQESALVYPDDLFDGIHPNQTGYDKMADIWLSALEEIIGELPVILSQPLTKGTIEGDSVSFKIIAEGSEYLYYQWQKNGVDIPGADSNVLSIQFADINDNNTTYSCKVSNLLGITQSEEAILYVTQSTNRVAGGQQLYYDFNENSGNNIFDKSGVEDAVDLIIDSISSISWINQGLKITAPTLIYSEVEAKKIFSSSLQNNEISVEAWIAPDNLSQTGNSTIFSFGNNSDSSNFQLLHEFNRYNFRLRTSNTSQAGSSLFSNQTIENKYLVHLLYTKSRSGISKMFINGNLENMDSISGDFFNWDSTYNLTFGNDLSEDSPWLGAFFQFAVFNRELSPNEILNNYNFGIAGITDLAEPTDLTATLIDEDKVKLDWTDNNDNELGYIIERYERGDELFNVIDSTSENRNFYIDSNVITGIKYQYRVKTFIDYYVSLPSQQSEITLPLPPPTELTGEVNPSEYVNLQWVDNSFNEIGFVIEGRPAVQDSSYSLIDSVSSNVTLYEDKSPKFYTPYEYRVYAYTLDANSDFSNSAIIDVVGIDVNNNIIPTDYQLKQNYPNPFNPATKIAFSIPAASDVTLRLYDILGRSIKILIDEKLNAGEYEIKFKVKKLPSGIYFYSLNAKSVDGLKEFKDVKKLVIQK